KRRNAVSGYSVSAAHDKIVGPMALDSASQNGHRQRAPEVIAENTSDSVELLRFPGRTSPSDPAGNNWDAKTPAPTEDAAMPRVPARPLGSRNSRSSDVNGSAG